MVEMRFLMLLIEKKDHLKWIIALTDGLDNCSKISYEDIYEKLKYNYHLIHILFH